MQSAYIIKTEVSVEVNNNFAHAAQYNNMSCTKMSLANGWTIL
jgi:hypothetical protein